MKIFTEKGILKKIFIILVVIILFKAIIPVNVSYAGTVDDIEKVGGPLIKPIIDVILAIADFAMDFLHDIVYNMETSLIRIDTDNGILEFVGIAFAAIVTFVLIAAVAGGLTVGAVLLLKKFVEVGIGLAGITAIATVAVNGAIFAGIFVRSTWFSNEIVMPLYRITPEAIFSGEINLLNVNFFKEQEYEEDELDQILEIKNYTNIYNINYSETRQFSGYGYNVSGTHMSGYTDEQALEEINTQLKNYGYSGEEITEIKDFTIRWDHIVNNAANGKKETKAREAILKVEKNMSYQNGISVEIVDRELTINEGEWGYTKHATLGEQLRPSVTKWYYAVRNFSLIAMMIILLYIGIRMMLCGVSSQKAKYKNMLIDWIVAVCLIFVMHYIMVFAMNVADSIIDIFGSINQSKKYTLIYEGDIKIINALKDAGIDVDAEQITFKENGKKYIAWDARSIVGFARVQAALNNAGNFKYIGWVMSYCVLVCYTVFFLFTYFKRVIYLTFFTIIAPLVAMTYPIDKIHDGKAQAFDMWLKEYIFNLMIQPVHLLLYTVLISSAFDLASTNILYTLVAIGFLMHAEKLLRKMFGFGKAETPGMLSGAAGTAIMMSTIDKLIPKKSKKDEGSKDGDEKEKEDKDKPKVNLPGDSFWDGFGGAGSSSPIDGEKIKKDLHKKVRKFSRNIADGKPVRSMARTMKRVYFGTAGALAGTIISLADDEPVKKLQQNIPTLYKAGDAYGSRK